MDVRNGMRLMAPLLAVVFLAGCGSSSTTGPGGTSSGSKDLGKVEVRQYRGEKLGAIADFRENSIKGPQKVDRNTYRLRVDGAVATPASYRYADVLSKEATHTKVVQLDCVEGWSVKALWEGVLLSDLIDRAKPSSDAVTVIFHAADGYSTSLRLAYVRERKILLAYKLNGVELPEERGFPFQVVAEDKWGYKWCRWVTRIEISTKADYRGYWESRGYSNSGNLSEPSVGP
jgi:DMSO/TMAO reductase YedYZ molybdopterin-dependent catalytic subunit